MWLVGRVCEEFGCLPSEAARELETDPERMALEIMELRAYARASQYLKQCVKAGEKPEHSRMVEWVMRVKAALLGIE